MGNLCPHCENMVAGTGVQSDRVTFIYKKTNDEDQTLHLDQPVFRHCEIMVADTEVESDYLKVTFIQN